MDTNTLRRDLDTFHETDRFTRLIIFSSDHDFPAFAAENDIHYKTVMGLYQGIIEESYVVGTYNIHTITAGGVLKGQESVLLLAAQEAVYGGQRGVFLVDVSSDGYLDWNICYIGKWHKVSTNEALHSDAWTCYPEDNAWYVAKMPEVDV